MPQSLLATLWSESESRTFSFDEEMHSVVWIGADKSPSADDAVASLGKSDEELLLSVCNGWTFADGSIDDSRPLGTGSHVIPINSPDGGNAVLYIRPSAAGVRRFHRMGVVENADLIIGRNDDCDIRYANPYVSGDHARLVIRDGSFSIQDLESANGTMVNGCRVRGRQQLMLQPGDVVEILDLAVVIGRDFVSLNSPDGVEVKQSAALFPVSAEDIRAAYESPREAAEDEEPFYPAPRLSQAVHPVKMQVDDPPMKKQQEELPVLMQIGPSFFMALSSVMMAVSSISRFMGGGDLLSTLPTVFMALAMLGGSLIWPAISRRYTRKKDARDEENRQQQYVKYLAGVKMKLDREAETQKGILAESRLPIDELAERVGRRSSLLMNRASTNSDFMELRVGRGDVPIQADVAWPQRHFTLDSDRMIDRVEELSKNMPMLGDVPLAFNPVDDFVAGIVGKRADTWAFLRGLLFQICTLYSYQEVKIILIANEDERPEWDHLLSLGHLYDNRGLHRMIALSPSGIVKEDMLLEQELSSRMEERANNPGDYGCYYVVLCTDKSLSDRSEAVRRISKLRTNLGFSIIYLGEELRDLPRECSYIIELDYKNGMGVGQTAPTSGVREDRQRARSSRMFKREDVNGSTKLFDSDIQFDRERARSCALGLSRVRLDTPEERDSMPESLGFLEMFKVGKASHLNIGQRWSENDASHSLQTPIGQGDGAENAYLDLHESVHGPHGLIAGTTGSGKSEFIISYVLSLCVNYSPDEVAFVLIDYKGGGLAGAFDNETYHLPHLAGTITNLDGASIHRSLSSIQSELRRRQSLFNRAREITGEATIDIYKYLSYYRQGVLDEPLPHLFIVADEFAELKQQEPEFMDELISAARIGRSLGVHLILATQKPSGVVNDQIWSNARFKVCLKVSDAGDSREMIHREDAALITRPGQYYLLVGYDEAFHAGQAAYAGGGYVPSDQFEPKRDTAIELLDDEGEPISRLRKQQASVRADSSELNAVLAEIIQAAELSGKHARRLWLDPLPDSIVLSDLEQNYGVSEKVGLLLTIGEVDDPDNQRRFRYEADLIESGNILIYGVQGSGADDLVKTMLYSAASNYGPKNLWMYLLDLGPGSLLGLTELPHCGGAAVAGDGELVDNLLRMLEGEIERRRRLFRPYGGSIDAYNAKSDFHEPRIIVGIANLTSADELFEGTVERLTALTHEGPGFGIHFVASASSTMAVRIRLRSNFGLEIPTMLNDRSDYMTVLGSIADVAVPHQELRGLIRIEGKVYVFQGAQIAADAESQADAIESLAKKTLEMDSTEVRQIPRLPDRIHVDDMGVLPASMLPVGFSRKGIAPIGFDIAKSSYMLIMASDGDFLGMYLRGLHEYLASGQAGSYAAIDPQGILGESDDQNVLQETEEIEAYLGDLCSGDVKPSILLFTSMAQTIAGLSPGLSDAVQTYIVQECGIRTTSIVAASEAWRVRSLYQDWFKVVSAYGNGVWAGGGFSDQTVFRFGRSLPEFRQAPARSDGFFVMRGEVVPVRLIEASDEPDDGFMPREEL